MSLSLLKSNELGISNQELFYVSRRIFLQNHKFQKHSSSIDNALKLTVNHSQNTHKKINNSDNKTTSKMSPAKIIIHNSVSDYKTIIKHSKKSNNSSFETFFNTTAQHTSIQTKKEYAKSRERLILSRLLECTHKKSISREEIQSDTKGLLKSLEEIPRDQQWRNIKSKVPKYSFDKRSPKKTIFEISQKDPPDESQFNNYTLKKPDNTHTLSIEKALPRPLDENPKKRSILKLKNLKQFLSNKSSIEDLDYQSNKNVQCNYSNEHTNTSISKNPNSNTSCFYNPRQQDLNLHHNAMNEHIFEDIENSVPNTQRLNAYQELFDIELDYAQYQQYVQEPSRAPVENCRYLKWSQQNKRFDKLKEENNNQACQPRINQRYNINKSKTNFNHSAGAFVQNQIIQLQSQQRFPDIHPFDTTIKISNQQLFLPVNQKSFSPEQISHFKVKNNNISQNQSRKASLGSSLDVLGVRYYPKDKSYFDVLRKSSIS